DVTVSPLEVVFHAVPELRAHEDNEGRIDVEPRQQARLDHPSDLAVVAREHLQALPPDARRAPDVVRQRALVGRDVEPLARNPTVRLDEAAGAADVVAVELAGVDEVPADEAVPGADREQRGNGDSHWRDTAEARRRHDAG